MADSFIAAACGFAERKMGESFVLFFCMWYQFHRRPSQTFNPVKSKSQGV